MKSLKIAHIADTHLGYRYSVLPDRDDDFMMSWLHACRAIVDSSPDLIIHAGDVFHTHRPGWKALTAFSTGIDILQQAEVPILMIAGNHDTAGLSSVHTFFTFASQLYPNIVSTNDTSPSAHYLAALDVDVVLVPHRSLLNPLLADEMKQITEGLTGGFSILVSHGSISKETNPFEQGSLAIPHSITEYPWNYMAFGHLHLSQPYGKNGWYSGSTERCGWSDFPASPAWTLVEVGKNKSVRHSQMPVPHMEFVDLPDIDGQDLSSADVCLRIIESLESKKIPEERCHIRVKIDNFSATARRPVESLLRKAMKNEYPKAFVSINLTNVDQLSYTNFDETVHPQLKPIPVMFKEFVEERQYENKKFQEEFLEKGLELLSRGYEDTNQEADT